MTGIELIAAERWQQGRLLSTPQTVRWDKDQWAISNAREQCLVVANFREEDQGRSRRIIAECHSPLQAAALVEQHNALIDQLVIDQAKLGKVEPFAMNPKDPAGVIVNKLYYHQKDDGCRHDWHCGKICYNCVEDVISTLSGTVAQMSETLETIAAFAVGNGDVCEIIARRARAALYPIDPLPSMPQNESQSCPTT